MSLNTRDNKYHCFRCGEGGYSIGLYARVREIDNKKAFKELIEKECYSLDRSNLEITPINSLADIERRDKIYRKFLGMLKLESNHKKYLKNLGFLDSSIENIMFKSIPKNYIHRRIIGYSLSKEFDLCGIPGFFQEEDFKWYFAKNEGILIPVLNENGLIQGLSIHLDKPYNNNRDIWFSSNNKINGTNAKNWVMRNNINNESEKIIITDNLLLGNLIKETINAPMFAFQNITNSYAVLKEIEQSGIRDVLFVIRLSHADENLDYIINRIFKDLVPLGLNIDAKYITDYKDFFNESFDTTFVLNRAS